MKKRLYSYVGQITQLHTETGVPTPNEMLEEPDYDDDGDLDTKAWVLKCNHCGNTIKLILDANDNIIGAECHSCSDKAPSAN